MSTHTKCLITGAEDISPLNRYNENFLVQSKSSQFVFCSKIPSEEELIQHYTNYPIGYNADSAITRIRINEFLDTCEKYRKTNKIIDVGCGPGLFLIEAKKRGWEVCGTEFTDNQLTYLRGQGIQAEKGRLSASLFEDNQFDVLISSEVIEHINNPLEEMQQFHRLLRKGGLLYITTPNFNAIERLILKDKWEIIGYPEHLCYYTPKTIDLLLKKSGFKKKKITTTGISVDRIKRGLKSQHKGEQIQGLSDEKLRESLEKGYKKFVKKIVNKILSIFGVGNSLKVWYEKN